MWGDCGTQYRVRLYPLLGIGIYTQDIILLGSTTKKSPLNCWGVEGVAAVLPVKERRHVVKAT